MPRTLPSGLTTWLNNFPLLESHSTLSVYLPFSEDADTFYFATLPTVLDGEEYRGALKNVGELKLSMGRAADRVEVTISNVDGLQGGIFLQSRDVLRGNVVRIGRLYYNPQDPTTQHHVILFTGTIASVSVDETDIRLSIVSDLYGGGMVGATRLVSPTCQFKFKDANTCAYSGGETTCNKLYDDAGGCSGRSNQHHFGGALFKDSKAGLQTIVGGPVPAFQLVASSDGVDDTDVEQATKLVFENCTVETDLENNRTVVTPNGTAIEGDPIQVLYIKPDNSPGTDANFDYDINQNVVRAAGGFHNTVEAINVQTYGMVSGLFAAGSTATGTAGINSSTDQLTFVTSVGDFKVGHGIAIPGAGVSGATLYTTITNITGLVATLADNASTTVAGATIQHDDTPAIQAAIDAAETSSDRAVMLPKGTYRLRNTLTANGEVRIYGESKLSTILYSTANEPIVTLGKNTSTYQGPIIENLTIRGDVSAGSAQVGLKCDDIEYMFMVGVRNVRIEDCGGVGLFVGKSFASSFVDLYISNCAGYPLVYDAQDMPANYFRRVDVGLLRDSAPVCYRIKAGYFFGQALNATYGLNENSLIGLVGRKSGVDGDVTSNGAVAVWDSCNFESYTLGAVHHYYSSRSIFRGVCTFAAQASIILDPAGVSSGATTITANSTNGFPSSGKIQMELETISYTSKNSTQFLGCTRGIDGTTAASHPQYTIVANKQVMPLKYEMDTISSYPALVIRGTIDDNCNFNDGPELRYKNNQAVHSNAIPPLMTTGRGPGASNEQPPIGTYYNSTSGTIEALQRADGMLKRITVEDTKVFTDQGVRWIEVNNTSGGPIDITLPPPNLIKTQELLIVKDVAGNASTHNISIYGGGGAPIEGAGVFTLTKDGQSAIFISNEADTVTGSWRLTAVNPPVGGVTTTGGGLADFLPIYTSDDEITAGPLYRIGGTTIVSKDSLVAETDDVRDIGGDGFNRFRDIFAARKFKAPAFVTPGANGLYGGSGDPEGVVTAEPGSIYLRTNGSWYRKVSGSSDTGWVLQGGSVTSSGSGLADFIAFFSSDSNITGGPIYKSGTTTIFKGSAIPETNNSYDLGSASLKWRSGYFGTKVQTVTYEFTDGLTISAGSGSPEGVLTANPGSLYLDEGGTLYRKASGFSNTGWVLVGTITALTGDVTASGAGSVTTTIANDAVTFAKMQNISSSKLLGRYSGGSGDVQEITISTGLNLDGSGNLTVTGGGANAALSNLASVAINTTLLPASNNSLDHGSPSLKWRSGYFGTKVQTVAYEFTDGLTISTGAGSPEGVVSAPLGSMYLDNSAGVWYRKASGFSTTGWIRGDVSAGANTALSNIASVAIPVSLISDTDNTDDLGSSSINWRDGFFGRDLTVKRRLIGGGSVPSSSTGTGAGTSPSIVVDGSQLGCFVSVTTGSSPATNAKIFDLTLSAAPNYYIATLTPVNAAAKSLSGNQQVFISDADATTTKVTVKSGSTGLAGSTTYDWYLTFIAV